MTLFEKALAFAIKAHEGQKRKRSGTPYILHPCEAAAIAATLTSDEEVLAAVLLHDTLEDTDTTAHQLKEAFGERVMQLVEGETEEKYASLPREESWQLRKEESLEQLFTTADKAVKIMWLSDKLSNMRSFYRLYLEDGDKLWERFHQKDKHKQEWYYREVARAVSELKDTAAYREYTVLMNIVFGGAYENE